MIEIRNLTKRFGKHQALDGVTLEIAPGEGVILIGQNGAGKTTLIRTLLGEYRPDSGYVRIDGFDPLKDRAGALEEVAFVPQLPPPIRLSVAELLEYAAIGGQADSAAIEDYCQHMDLDLAAHKNKIFFRLSGGMKQKLLIAIALARKAQLLIFDEPTANLDPLGRERFYEILHEKRAQQTHLFVSHRIEELKNLASRAVEMDLGKVVRDEKL